MSSILWQYSQGFGDQQETQTINNADIISCLQFDSDGHFLATGDRGGRVVLFRLRGSTPRRSDLSERIDDAPRFDYFTEFQSHDTEFDYLRSMDIEEKINQIQWLKPAGESSFLLSTNDKTIKLWRVREKISRHKTSSCVEGFLTTRSLHLPQAYASTPTVSCTNKRTYPHAHTYNINSLSINSDGETFLSADDLRINLWHSEVSASSFNIVDLKPECMESLSEVITSARFHPEHCSLFLYGTSKGCVKAVDMRERALCDNLAKVYEPGRPQSNSVYNEIVSSITDIQFCADKRYFVTRDFMSLRIWDSHMESQPLVRVPIHEHLRSRFAELSNNECLFDRFQCAVSADGRSIFTGSYSNQLSVFDRRGREQSVLQTVSAPPSQRATNQSGAMRFARRFGFRKGPSAPEQEENFVRKVVSLSAHPKEPCLAVAAACNLYIFLGSSEFSSSEEESDKANL